MRQKFHFDQPPATLFEYQEWINSDNQAEQEKYESPVDGRLPLGGITLTTQKEQQKDSVESPPSRRRKAKMENLRQRDWYLKRLQEIDFNFDDIGLDKPLSDLMDFYGSHLERLAGSSLYEVDKNILRVELHEIVKEENSNLARLICKRFPGQHNYKHKRHSAYEDRFVDRLDREDPLDFNNDKAIYIVNLVGGNALFKKSSYKKKKDIFKDRSNPNQGVNLERIKNFSIYKILPGHFLLARIWCARSLCRFLETSSNLSLKETVEYFEALNNDARDALKHPKKYHVDSAYICLHMSEYTRPIEKDSEAFLLQHDQELSAQRSIRNR